ncbi:DUF2243 domain-containing protein [Myxacorys almedinensis]|uniref:DUF2243 domain-containing protein n=1 Tax=Myxacorys almedinensis A TaxID=2690445 RepID=A0A8J7Z3A1_9CYAN|nr:DUF2243 domain-containing protein [Myxacorys almedinensis]NDJ17333.1 DUF2243 domain-containing protein [Myxacorys almedinensis A]
MKATNFSTSGTVQVLPKRLIAAGILLGLGLAGFFDGIVLHQILQWHHLLSNVRPILSLDDVSANTLADGLFHLLAYLFAIAGVITLWQTHQQTEMPKSAQPLLGAILIGAGTFNLSEGLIDHQILGIHHVRSGTHYILWDIGFLVIGALLILIGIGFIQRWRNASQSIDHSPSIE